MEGDERASKKPRTTGLATHTWTEEQDIFLAFCVALGLSVQAIIDLFKDVYKEVLREAQVKGRIVEVKKSTKSLLLELQSFHDLPIRELS
jgi:hypothetical protein